MRYIIVLLIVLISSTCFAFVPREIDDEQLCDAIYKAEGGSTATYLYGIRSVHYEDEAEARRICLNTIRNNKIRFYNQDKYDDFYEFLGSRYCPVGCDNDTGSNKYWVKNVRYFYNVHQDAQ